jgi:hypothetical protein
MVYTVSSASAVEVSGRSSTQLLWYNDIVDGSKQMDLAEYLRISMTGIDDKGKVSLQGYGRLVWDIKDVKEGEDRVQERLYYLYADIKDVLPDTDVRLGRQFINLSAGTALIDGLQAEIKNVGPVGFTVMGGRDIKFGEEGQLTSHAYALGVATYLTGLKTTDLDISYFRAYDYSEVVRDIVGASFKQYVANSVKLYANARYDLTAEVFNEILGGVKFFPTLDLMLTAEYYESYPTFDTTSIYSVFAVNKYKEALIFADYTVLQNLDLSAGYTHEIFGDGEAANLYEVGVRYRPAVNLTIGLFHDGRSGYGGDLDGYRVYVEYSRLAKWKAAAGVDYDSYQRDNMTGDETAKRYWAAGRYMFTKVMSASVRVEDNVNVNYSSDVQGRATFDYDF